MKPIQQHNNAARIDDAIVSAAAALSQQGPHHMAPSAAGNGRRGHGPGTSVPQCPPCQTTNTHPERGWSTQRLLTSNFKHLGTPPQVGQRFLTLLLTSSRYLPALLELLQIQPGTTKDFSLEIDAFELVQKDPVLGHMLLRFPATLLPLLEDAIVEAQRILKHRITSSQTLSTSSSIAGVPLLVKGEGGSNGLTRLHARLTHLPPHTSCCKASLASLRASDTNQIVQVAGTVTKTSGVHMYESTRSYKCGDKKCGATFCVYADLEQHNNALPFPKVCPGTNMDGGPCKSTRFELLEGQSVHTDYQEVKIQESRGSANLGMGSRIGSIPRSLLIKLQHDLVDRCQPGDEIVCVGSLISQWPEVRVGGLGGDVGVALHAHSIRIINAEDSMAWDDGNSGSGGGMNSRMVGANKGAAVRDEMRREFDELWESQGARTYPLAIRNMIVRSICPRLYAMHTIKLALLVTLIGGASAADGAEEEGGILNSNTPGAENVTEDAPEQFLLSFGTGPDTASPMQQDYGYGSRTQPSQMTPTATRKRKSKSRSVQTKRREQSHLLLVGDPGTGKSQFLRFAASLCPRSVMTTGTGTTSAGLTCAAVREGKRGEYGLEAGALVLADKGVCCIDEFGCIRDEERTTIHEAMEQQTLSVAKAGIVCKLNCRATVIAVTNAKGGLYDHDKTLTANTGIDPPLMSRFDLVFRLIDDSNAERDDKIATFLLNNAIEGFGYDVAATNQNSATTEKAWNMDKLRAYIATVKGRFHPSVSKEAAELLEKHYGKCRESDCAITVTVRFLESLIRLSQAHARLMYRNVVTLQDATAAILLMECSAGCVRGFRPHLQDPNANMMYRDPMTTNFPEDNIADIEFLCDQYMLLEEYDMIHCLSEEEKAKVFEYLQKYRQDDGFGPPAGPDNGATGGDSDHWNQYENSHGKQPPSINEYVTGNFNSGVSNGQEGTVGSNHGTQVDHYGRLTQSTRKAPRSTKRSARRHSSGHNSSDDPGADYASRLEQFSATAGNGGSTPPLSLDGAQQSQQPAVSGAWDRISAPEASAGSKKRRRSAD